MRIIDELLITAAVIWWGFVVWYWIRSKWWKNRYARNMMGVGANIAIVYTLLALLVTIGWQPWMLWLWLAQIVSMIVLGAQRTYFAEQVQRERHADH